MTLDKLILILFLAIIGAIIGWLTNLIAIKLLFRPIKAINIPLINWKLQGLIPKRKEEMAASIGKTVEEDLLSLDDIIKKILNKEELEKIKVLLKTKIYNIVEKKLPPIIPSTFKKMILGYVEDMISTEGDELVNQFIFEYLNKAKDKISISEIVEEKINSYDMVKIEEIVISIAKKELKHIEILGGVLGFIIGIIQGVVVLYLL